MKLLISLLLGKKYAIINPGYLTQKRMVVQ